MPPHEFSIGVRVRYVECDMQGHVFNGHYLTWFDMAHTALLQEAIGRPWLEVVAGGVDLVVAESGVRYLAGAHFDEQLTIAVGLEPLTTTSVTSRFEVRRNQHIIATGFLRHVCVEAPAMTKRPWPDELRAALSKYASEPS